MFLLLLCISFSFLCCSAHFVSPTLLFAPTGWYGRSSVGNGTACACGLVPVHAPVRARNLAGVCAVRRRHSGMCVSVCACLFFVFCFVLFCFFVVFFFLLWTRAGSRT